MDISHLKNAAKKGFLEELQILQTIDVEEFVRQELEAGKKDPIFSLLWEAVKYEQLDCVQLLVKVGCQAKLLSFHNLDQIVHAVVLNKKYLDYLGETEDVDGARYLDILEMHSAHISDSIQLSIFKLLLTYFQQVGCGVNCKDKNGNSFIISTVRFRKESWKEWADELVQYGADVNIVNHKLCSAAWYAACLGHSAKLQWLVDNAAIIDVTLGKCPLIAAVKHIRNYECIRILLDNDVPVNNSDPIRNKRCKRSMTAVEYALKFRKYNEAAMILMCGSRDVAQLEKAYITPHVESCVIGCLRNLWTSQLFLAYLTTHGAQLDPCLIGGLMGSVLRLHADHHKVAWICFLIESSCEQCAWELANLPSELPDLSGEHRKAISEQYARRHSSLFHVARRRLFHLVAKSCVRSQGESQGLTYRERLNTLQLPDLVKDSLLMPDLVEMIVTLVTPADLLSTTIQASSSGTFMDWFPIGYLDDYDSG